MEPGYSYITAFDLDRTLIAVNSSRLIVTASREMGFMNRKQLTEAMYFSIIYKFDLKEPTKIVLSMMKWLKDKSEDEVIKITKEQIIPKLIKSIRPEIKDAITHHKNNNAKVIILSSALPYLCEPLARHLGMDDVICSRMEVKNGLFTGNSIGKLVYRDEKEVQMKAYCKKHKFSLENAWYYGDAYTDRFILSTVGNPVCVKPEIKLRLLALRKGWAIL